MARERVCPAATWAAVEQRHESSDVVYLGSGAQADTAKDRVKAIPQCIGSVDQMPICFKSRKFLDEK